MNLLKRGNLAARNEKITLNLEHHNKTGSKQMHNFLMWNMSGIKKVTKHETVKSSGQN